MADLPSPPSPGMPSETQPDPVARSTAPDLPSSGSLLPEHGDDLQTYQPLSGLAIVGFCLALIFAAIIIIGGIAALLLHSPLLLGPLTILPLPILAAILCYLARLQITRSEGTRAGLSLAKWGWRMSVVLGLGYEAFYFATYFALLNQADGFTNNWLSLIRDGKLNQAFLLTQDPAVRAMVNAEDEAQMNIRFNVGAAPNRPGPLAHFRQMDLVRALRQGGAESKILTLGVREWDWVGQRRNVKRGYRIETPEGDFDTVVSVQGITSTKGEFQGRQWVVRMEGTGVLDKKLTERGDLLITLRDQSHGFAQRWFEKVATQQYAAAYVDTCEPAERTKLEAIYWGRLCLLNLLPPPSAPGASGLGSGASRWAPWSASYWTVNTYLPGFAERTDKLLEVDEAKFKATDAVMRKHGIAAFKALLKPELQPVPLRGAIVDVNSIQQPLTVTGERAQVRHDARVAFLPYQVNVVIITESTPDYQDPARVPSWRIVRLEMVGVQDVNQNQPSVPMLSTGTPAPGAAKPEGP